MPNIKNNSGKFLIVRQSSFDQQNMKTRKRFAAEILILPQEHHATKACQFIPFRYLISNYQFRYRLNCSQTKLAVIILIL